MPSDSVEVSVDIAAPAAAIYDLVSDLPRMGEWSPEATGGRWLGEAAGAAVGAKFRGHNRSGWRRWSTTVTVTEADPGKRFVFRVTTGPIAVSEWSYDLSPSPSGGTTVVERWSEHRPGWMRALSIPLMGVSDRAAHNRTTMEHTLAALKGTAEG
jgi:uncharacterized protein YndB with AHSA1/START domain